MPQEETGDTRMHIHILFLLHELCGKIYKIQCLLFFCYFKF